MHLAMLEIKNTQQNLHACVIIYTSPKIYHDFQGIHHYMVNMKIVCVFNHVLLTSGKISDRSPDNNSNAKTKLQKGVTQGAVSCQYVS